MTVPLLFDSVTHVSGNMRSLWDALLVGAAARMRSDGSQSAAVLLLASPCHW